MRVSIVVAAASNGVIGSQGKIPWRLPDDQRFFRRLTLGHSIVLGRKTFDSIGRALPGRENLVLTRSRRQPVEGVRFFPDLDSALAWARSSGEDECFIAGGEAIYREALAIVDRVYWTRVETRPEGDTFFADLDESVFRLIDRETHPRDARHAHPFAIETWERIRESEAS